MRVIDIPSFIHYSNRLRAMLLIFGRGRFSLLHRETREERSLWSIFYSVYPPPPIRLPPRQTRTGQQNNQQSRPLPAVRSSKRYFSSKGKLLLGRSTRIAHPNSINSHSVCSPLLSWLPMISMTLIGFRFLLLVLLRSFALQVSDASRLIRHRVSVGIRNQMVQIRIR